MTDPSRPGQQAEVAEPNTADLRARNRSRNREDVAAVALSLFARHGFDAVTVDDIVAAAGISRRTFFRYFDSKEDAVLPHEEDRLESLHEVLDARRADEPVLVCIRDAILSMATELDLVDKTDALTRMRVIQESPSVRAHSLEIQTRMEDAVRDMVAAHLGVDSATSVEAHVVASATLAAFRAAVEVWVALDGARDLAELLREAYEVLGAGIAVDHGPSSELPD